MTLTSNMVDSAVKNFTRTQGTIPTTGYAYFVMGIVFLGFGITHRDDNLLLIMGLIFAALGVRYIWLRPRK